jgi:hypothetical protein
MTNIRALALHEATHAVCATVLGGRVDKVTIRPDDPEHPGEVTFKPYTRRPGVKEAEDRIVSNLAAGIAVSRAGGGWDGCEGDWHDAAEDAVLVAGSDDEAAVRAVLDRLALRAAALVQQHGDAIVTAAVLLMEHHSLSGKQVAELCNPKLTAFKEAVATGRALDDVVHERRAAVAQLRELHERRYPRPVASE